MGGVTMPYLDQAFEDIKKAAQPPNQLRAEHLFKLNEAVFNLPETESVDDKLANKLYQAMKIIHKSFTHEQYNDADKNFAYDYVALLGTMQNQYFFSDEITDVIFGWIWEAVNGRAVKVPHNETKAETKAQGGAKRNQQQNSGGWDEYERPERDRGHWNAWDGDDSGYDFGGKGRSGKGKGKGKEKGKGVPGKGKGKSKSIDIWEGGKEEYWEEPAPKSYKGGKGSGGKGGKNGGKTSFDYDEADDDWNNKGNSKGAKGKGKSKNEEPSAKGAKGKEKGAKKGKDLEEEDAAKKGKKGKGKADVKGWEPKLDTEKSGKGKKGKGKK